jgi:glycosyltransferase involved in cell wall biosynthesis
MNYLRMNTDQPIVSIITVVFNGERFLEATIKSVINQEYKNYEYIIIDGGSTDGTLDIIRKYEKQVSKWTSGTDSGLYDAMNKGIDLATGDYLWFLNAGDEIFDKNTLSNIFKNSENLADVLYGETIIIDNDRKEIGMRRQKIPEKLTWKSLKKGMVVSHQSILVRKDIAPHYDLQYSCSSDIDWVIKSLKSAKNIINTHQILSRFMDGGRSKSTIVPSLKERFRIMVRNYGIFSTLISHIPIAFRFFTFLLRNRRF